MQGTIMTITVIAFTIFRLTTVILKKKKKKKALAERKAQLEKDTRTFEKLDHITVGEFASVIDGRPMFSMEEYKDRVISSVTRDKISKEDCVYFWEKVPEDMSHEDILFMEELDEMALFVVADRKIDLLRTYVVDDVRRAYNDLMRVYNLTERFLAASAVNIEAEDDFEY